MRIGIDLILISRFEKKSVSFLSKNFTQNEIDYASKKPNPAQTYAGLFACKEAFLKAVSVGVFNGISLGEIEILHTQNGAPFLNLSKKIKKQFNIKKSSISISHEGENAIAICMIN